MAIFSLTNGSRRLRYNKTTYINSITDVRGFLLNIIKNKTDFPYYKYKNRGMLTYFDQHSSVLLDIVLL